MLKLQTLKCPNQEAVRTLSTSIVRSLAFQGHRLRLPLSVRCFDTQVSRLDYRNDQFELTKGMNAQNCSAFVMMEYETSIHEGFSISVAECAKVYYFSRRGASFQHAYFSPKYPYLPDLVFNDSLFQVQHRLDYLGPMLVVISIGSCHSSFPHHSYKYWHALSWSRRERHQYPSAKSTNTYPTTFKTTAPTELSTTHLWVFGGIASCC